MPGIQEYRPTCDVISGNPEAKYSISATGCPNVFSASHNYGISSKIKADYEFFSHDQFEVEICFEDRYYFK